MTAKKTPKPADRKKAGRDSNTLQVETTREEELNFAVTRAALRPDVRAASVIKDFSQVNFPDLLLAGLVSELTNQSTAVHGGDLKRAESMLIVQAHTLDAIFGELARRAALNMGEYLDATERYMRLALKAQGQCRATLETLAEIRNPRPVAFVKQANIANGPQQVNNGSFQTDACTRARENANPSNELLPETIEHGAMDPGAASAAGRTNQELATVGEIDRAKIRQR